MATKAVAAHLNWLTSNGERLPDDLTLMEAPTGLSLAKVAARFDPLALRWTPLCQHEDILV